MRQAVREHLVYAQTLDSLPLNEALLLEGMDMGKMKDAIQFLVGAAAEYGLGALTMPAAGAGLAVGPTVQTMVDALFAAEEVLSTVNAVKNLVTEVGEFVSLVEEAISSYGGSLDAFYDKLVEVVQKGLGLLGDGAVEAIDDLAEQLKEAIDKVIKKVAGAMGAGIKVVIPDATAAGLVGLGLEELLGALAENAYTLLVKLLDSDPTGLIKKFVQDPSIAVDFFQSVFDQVIALLREAGGQVEAGKTGEEGAQAQAQISEADDTGMSGLAGQAAIKALGASGALDKMADMIAGQMPKIMNLIDAVLNVLMPAIISCLGIYEILMKGDYQPPKKEEEEGEEKEGGEEKQMKEAKDLRIMRRRIRRIIKENLPPWMIDAIRQREEEEELAREQGRRLPLRRPPPLEEYLEDEEEDEPRGIEIIDYRLAKEGRNVRIKKSTLERIIRETLLKEEMLKIISNPHSPETEVFNRIANYALNNDIQGALADSEVNTPDLDLDIDSMGEWVNRVGEENWMSDDAIVPDNWDPDIVWDFMEDLERAWYDQNRAQASQTSASAPDLPEREALAGAFTTTVILPDEIPSITYQIRRKGGQPNVIQLEDNDDSLGNMATSIDTRWARQHGTTLDKIISVLEKGGAQLRKKRKPIKHVPPMYD